MDRRRFLGLVPVAVGLVTGCSQLSGGLEIADASIASPVAGTIRMTVVVENTTPFSKSATLISRVDVDGGDTYTKRREITVPEDASRSYEFEFDADPDAMADGGHEFSAELQ